MKTSTPAERLGDIASELSHLHDLVQLISDSCRFSGVCEVVSAGNVAFNVCNQLFELTQQVTALAANLEATESEVSHA